MLAEKRPLIETATRMATDGFIRRLAQGTWVAYAASAWSLIYGALGLSWALGGSGFPFGENDPGAEAGLSLFAELGAETGGTAIAALGLFGALVGVMMATPVGRGVTRAALQAFAWSSCILLVLLVPDVRLLQNVAYALLLHFDRLDWPVVNQLLCVAGGLLWGAAAVVYGRRTGDGCIICGRTDSGGGWTTPAAAARWGRWATMVAVVAPLPYGIVRMAWFLGIPLGVSEAFVVSLNQDIAAKGGELLKYVFGSETIIGAILTLGLVQRWGEIFPRWIPLLAGRRVPIWLAVVPASLVAIAVTIAGRGILTTVILDGNFDFANWGLVGPALLWPIWGVALGLATLAYYYRRRGRCARCGRGQPVNNP